MERWSGRSGLVTGASAGIGAGITRALVQAGMKVAVCARNMEKLQALKEELKDLPGTVLPIKCDMRDEKQILSMFDVIKTELGGVDVCVNNAGLGINAPLLTGCTEDWKNMMDVNAMALLICSRESIKSMRERNVNDGHVLQINSMSGHRIIDKSEHFYAGTKHAVKVFTEGLRRELREIKSHIRITAISPGCVSTEFLEHMFSNDKELLAQMLEQEIKFLEVKDIVAAAMYALSAPPHAEINDILIRPVEQET